MIVILAIFLLFSVGALNQAEAQTSLGGLAGSPTRMGFGARGIGMGNALTAVTRGDIVGYYNPALVSFQAVPSGAASLGLLSLDRRLNFLGYTQAVKPAGGFSVGIINAGVGNIEGRDRNGVVTDSYSTSENAFLFSFGLQLSHRIAAGVTAKVYYYSLFEEISTTTAGVDIGLLYSIADDWKIGLVIQDINSKYRWDTTPLYGRDGNTTVDRFPLRQKLGVAFTPTAYRSTLSADVELIEDELLSRFGVEMSPMEGFQVRGGLDQVSFDGKVNAKPSLGVSFQTPIAHWKPALHYTYVFEPYGAGDLHFLSISLTFE